MSSTVVTKFGNRPVVEVPPFSVGQGYSNIVNIPENGRVPGVNVGTYHRYGDARIEDSYNHVLSIKDNQSDPFDNQFLAYSHYPFQQDVSPYSRRITYTDHRRTRQSDNFAEMEQHQNRNSNTNRHAYNAPFQTAQNNYSNIVQPVQTQVPVPGFSQNPAKIAGNGYNNNVSMPENNPGERHFYYGPNGERLPGPPDYASRKEIGRHSQHCETRSKRPRNFVVEGVLEFGRLSTIRLKNSSMSFQGLPDFLLREIEQNYRRYKQTNIRIVAENGEYSVYASPVVAEGCVIREEMYEPAPQTRDQIKPAVRKEWGAKFDPVEEYRPMSYFRDNVIDDAYASRQRQWRRKASSQVETNDFGGW